MNTPQVFIPKFSNNSLLNRQPEKLWQILTSSKPSTWKFWDLVQDRNSYIIVHCYAEINSSSTKTFFLYFQVEKRLDTHGYNDTSSLYFSRVFIWWNYILSKNKIINEKIATKNLYLTESFNRNSDVKIAQYTVRKCLKISMFWTYIRLINLYPAVFFHLVNVRHRFKT